MFVVGISTRADLRRFYAHAGIFVYELIGREIRECRVKYANGNFAPRARRSGGSALSLRRGSGKSMRRRDCSGDYAASGSQKIPASVREGIRIISHEVPQPGVQARTLYARRKELSYVGKNR